MTMTNTVSMPDMVWTKKLNLIFNIILLGLIAISFFFLASPLSTVSENFLTTENIQVLLLFITVLFMVNIYKQIGNVADYFLYWTRFIHNPRLSLIFTSMVLSILPVKGRTIISAPIIGQIAQKNNLNKFSAAMVDYIATHTVYLLLPIEGSVVVVLAAFAAIGFGLGTFIGYMLPGLIFLFAVVAYYSWKTSSFDGVKLSVPDVSFWQALKVSSPLVVLMFFLYLFEMVEVEYAIIVGIVIFLALSLAVLKPTKEQMKKAIASMDKQLMLTLVLIFLFASTFSQLPFVHEVAKAFIASGFTIPILIVVSYLAGFVLGDSKGMAALIFPILASLISGAPNAFQMIAISYAAMYAGYIASPAHPCCQYAASYFDQPYLKVWSRIAIYAACAAACIIVVALIRG